MKRKNRGFTIIELLTSFSLASVVMLFLFNILVIVKKNYTKNSVRSELVVNQSLLSSELYHDAYASTLVSVGGTKNDYTFGFRDSAGTTVTKNLKITSNSITYGDFTYKVNEDSDAQIATNETKMSQYSSGNISYMELRIPIYSSITGEKKDYGIRFVYLYDTGSISYTVR